MSSTQSPPATGGRPAVRRSGWRSVAVPNEHGGWGLTLEPVILGLFVVPSVAGLLIGAIAVLAFVARTPLRVVLVDARRGRDLERTALARKILAAEVIVLIGLAAGATALGDARLWLPALVAGPLIAVELWFDTHSHSRRLIPELAGAAGVSSVVAMIVLADGGSIGLSAALWMVLAARVVTAIPFVRAQVGLLHGRDTPARLGIISDVAALGMAAGAVVVDQATGAGAGLIAGVIVYQRITGKRPPERAAILGVRQTVVGLTIVLVTALGVLAP